MISLGWIRTGKDPVISGMLENFRERRKALKAVNLRLHEETGAVRLSEIIPFVLARQFIMAESVIVLQLMWKKRSGQVGKNICGKRGEWGGK